MVETSTVRNIRLDSANQTSNICFGELRAGTVGQCVDHNHSRVIGCHGLDSPLTLLLRAAVWRQCAGLIARASLPASRQFRFVSLGLQPPRRYNLSTLYAVEFIASRRQRQRKR